MKKDNMKVVKKLFYILGVIISIFLFFALVMNLTIVLKSYINPNQTPSFMGIKLFIVETNSMQPLFNGGDLIVTKNVDPEKLVVGDVISYKENRVIVTHRIEEINPEMDEEEKKADEKVYFATKGDANDTLDIKPIPGSSVESIYWFRIKNLGSFALFMQTPFGMLIFVGIPVLGFIARDILRQRKRVGLNNIEKDKEIQRLKEELERKEK